MTIRCCEIRGCHQGECHLHREENSNVDQIALGISTILTFVRDEMLHLQWKRAKQEEEIPDSPHYQRSAKVHVFRLWKLTEDEITKSIVIFGSIGSVGCCHSKQGGNDGAKSAVEEAKS